MIRGDDEARFFTRGDFISHPPCWLWAGPVAPDGYAHSTTKKSANTLVHRIAYEMWVGPIPEGLTVDHTCHNNSDCPGGVTCFHRRCFNPEHLEAVSQTLNNNRSPNGWAAKTHCPHGHEYTPENTYVRPRGGIRDCVTCRADRRRYKTGRRKGIRRTRAEIDADFRGAS